MPATTPACPRLLSIEWIALGSVATLIFHAGLHDPLYRAWWVGDGLLALALWGTALLVTPFAIYWGIADRGAPAEKVRRTIAMPLALVAAALLVGPAVEVGRWLDARITLGRHRAAFEIIAAQGKPVVFTTVHGIPDGGVAIIRSAGDPARLAPQRQMALVGERIRHCARLDRAYVVCSFD